MSVILALGTLGGAHSRETKARCFEHGIVAVHRSPRYEHLSETSTLARQPSR